MPDGLIWSRRPFLERKSIGSSPIRVTNNNTGSGITQKLSVTNEVDISNVVRGDCN